MHASAFALAAQPIVTQVMEVQEPPKTGTPYPVSIVALSGSVLDHPWWGRIAFQLDGMQPRGPKIPIDWGHDYESSIGYIDTFTRSGAELTVSGALIPFNSEDDKAGEVIVKSQAGIPYQASIDFTPRADGDWESVYVLDGQTVEANGQSYTGPLTLFTKWPLNAVAIYSHGADPFTSVDVPTQFSAKLPPGHPMKKNTQLTPPGAPAEPQKPDATPAPEITEVTPAATVLPPAQLTPQTATAPVAQPSTINHQPASSSTQLTADTLKSWSERFGAENAVAWLTAGKSEAEAFGLCLTDLRTQLTAKDAEIAQLKERLTQLRPGIEAPTGAAIPATADSKHSQLTPQEQAAQVINARMGGGTV